MSLAEPAASDPLTSVKSVHNDPLIRDFRRAFGLLLVAPGFDQRPWLPEL